MAVDGALHILNTAVDGIGVWVATTLAPEAFDMTQAVFTPTDQDVSFTHRGTRVISAGESGEWLIVLGHPPVREVLVAASAYYREVCGQRLRALNSDHPAPTPLLREWSRFIAYPTRSEWHSQPAQEGDAGAVPVTWLDTQAWATDDLGPVEHCPRCGRPSRSTDFALLQESWQRVHLCPHPECRHRWPATTASSAPSAKERD
ncbi:hypothetical protein [Streptomyces lutosisoli]|uniref:Uncharacterized protein n=1 Tax=Streptomyces lutosisoli TaxID=2665721 RepID=A0ABW2VTH1_9ACTN